ncbi:hypothetical protein ABPH35_08330 [Streptococcus sp. ZJ93]|uniref:hypothetical protein n=1 Tax=Streptococcus handemini TaxID=3161188 RepID=UPI0032EE090A
MKFKKSISACLVGLALFGAVLPSVLTVRVYADELSLTDDVQVLSENSEYRKVRNFSPELNQYVVYTFYKHTGFMDIERNGEIETYNLKEIGERELSSTIGFRAANSSMFSPWSYSSSGNRYTLRIAHASYGGVPVSKTVTRSGYNAGYIDNFTRDIDNIRSVEIDLLNTAGWELAITIIGALMTGGFGAIGAITSVATVVGIAEQLPPIYDRALYNYKHA